MKRTAELILDSRATLGEGVCWDAERHLLYWVDILEKEIHVFDPSTGNDHCIRIDHYVGAVACSSDGRLILATQQGFAKLDTDTEELTPICDPESHLPCNRFNDGKCDPVGRFWAGTMDLEGQGNGGSLYRLDPDRSVHRMVENVTISNGLAWSSDDKVMYYIDTGRSNVSAFDYDSDTGSIKCRRTVIQFDRNWGHPDGMTIDEEDMLWVAHCGSGCVARWNPRSGKLLEKIELPVSLVTNCVFGGRDLDTLFISSARITLNDDEIAQQPLAGGIFCVNPGIKGRVTPSFYG